MNIQEILAQLGIEEKNPCVHTGRGSSHQSEGEYVKIHAASDGTLLGSVQMADAATYDEAVKTAQSAYQVWKDIPAPKRGEVVRQIGDALRENKDALGALVSLEMG